MADEDITLDGQPLQSLRVADLKAALEQRNLPKSGQKNTLIKRLKGVSFGECYGRLCRVWPSLVGGDRLGGSSGWGCNGVWAREREYTSRLAHDIPPEQPLVSVFLTDDGAANKPSDRARGEKVSTGPHRVARS